MVCVTFDYIYLMQQVGDLVTAVIPRPMGLSETLPESMSYFQVSSIVEEASISFNPSMAMDTSGMPPAASELVFDSSIYGPVSSPITPMQSDDSLSVSETSDIGPMESTAIEDLEQQPSKLASVCSVYSLYKITTHAPI